jgi:NAD(P)-dependent dehydrogenase (short-subunit alcohol dehydrogenase family)
MTANIKMDGKANSKAHGTAHGKADAKAAAGKAGAVEQPVWMITGCSTGFGHELAKAALLRGFRTVATARKPEEIQDLASLGDALILPLDVTDATQVGNAVKAAQNRYGHIDVLVNNAGIGYFGAVEESDETQVRRMFEVNFYGTSRMIHAVLPQMRKRGAGCIVNLSSLGGLRGFPAVGYYNATKYAIEGLSEALRQEVAPLGISVMVVEPSGFRTDWAGRSANESNVHIPDYAATAGAWRHNVREVSGKQPGDPVRAAQAIIAAVAGGSPPQHLLLGKDAYEGAMAQLDALRVIFKAGEAVARAADAPAAPEHAVA